MPLTSRSPRTQNRFTVRGDLPADGATGIASERLEGTGAHVGNPDWFGDLRQNLTNHWMVQQR